MQAVLLPALDQIHQMYAILCGHFVLTLITLRTKPSKTKTVFRKIASAVISSCPNISTNGRGSITDGEKSLHEALTESMKKATGLRSFNHFFRNCKDKLNSLVIRKKKDKKFFMEQVFANDENAILESEDKHQLETSLKTAQPLLDEEEKRLTATLSPKFGAYLSNNEKMMSRSMIRNARKKAGMPTDKMGNVLRSYTNQSETVNIKLTRQKEAITGKARSKSDLTKLEFACDVWEQVDQQQQLELQLAICGLSEEYELADQVHYLSVNPEVWFEWPVEKRMEYTRKFNELTVEDVAKKKVLSLDKHHGKEDTEQEWREFSRGIQSIYSLPGLSVGLVTTVVKEAEKLLNCPNSVERMPYMNPTDPKTKYLVAAKDAKTGMYECSVHHNHLTCKCPCNTGLCKHSICVAERANLLKEHVDFVLKSSCHNKPSKSNLVEPHKNAAGNKGCSHRNP